jgi:cytochrome c biogenesis protein CcdA
MKKHKLLFLLSFVFFLIYLSFFCSQEQRRPSGEDPTAAGDSSQGGAIGAFLLGLLFGVVSTPCAVPILAVLLTLVASQGNIVYGGLLLLVYSLGHSALILIAGTFMGAAKRLIESRGLRRANLILQRAAGVIIILVGIYFLL